MIDEASAQTDYFTSRKKKVPFTMAIGNWQLMQECLPKHSCREQQERNKTKKQTNKVRREALAWKEVKWARKKEVQTAYYFLIKIQ